MKKEFFLVLVLMTFIFTAVNAQSSFGLFVEAGVNKLHKIKLRYPYYYTQPDERKLTTGLVFSSKAGVYYNALIKNKFTIGANLLYTAGGAEMTYTETYLHGKAQLTYTNRMRAIGFSPYIGYKYKKFYFTLGAQVLDIFWENEHEDWGGMNYRDVVERGFSMDYGITAGIAFQLNPKLVAESSFYYGLRLSDYTINQYEMKATQLTIGLKYSLWISKGNEIK